MGCYSRFHLSRQCEKPCSFKGVGRMQLGTLHFLSDKCEAFLKKSRWRLINRNLALLLIFGGIGLQTNFCAFADFRLKGLDPLAERCLRLGEEGVCAEALFRAEGLQRFAGSQENYPCQTRILGLEADLIMSQLGFGPGMFSENILKEVMQLCQGL